MVETISIVQVNSCSIRGEDASRPFVSATVPLVAEKSLGPNSELRAPSSERRLDLAGLAQGAFAAPGHGPAHAQRQHGHVEVPVRRGVEAPADLMAETGEGRVLRGHGVERKPKSHGAIIPSWMGEAEKKNN